MFAIDIETCPECGGRLRVIACIEDPSLIGEILGHVRSREAAAAIQARANDYDFLHFGLVDRLDAVPATDAELHKLWFERATALRPSFAEPYFLYAEHLAAEGRIDESKEYLAAARRIAPSSDGQGKGGQGDLRSGVRDRRRVDAAGLAK